MVKNMKDENCAKKIQLALEDTRVDFTIDIQKQIVVIEGGLDMVNIAKRVIHDQGFTIL